MNINKKKRSVARFKTEKRKRLVRKKDRCLYCRTRHHPLAHCPATVLV